MSRARLAVVGAFLIGGFLIFAAGLFLIGDRRMLFSDRFEVNATFSKVTGVQVGSLVRLAGLTAGEVLEIGIPSRPSDHFTVRMRLREDLHHLVRTDSPCSIQTDGIVGATFIQLGRGTDAAPVVANGATLPGTDPVEFADLIQEGRDTFQVVRQEIMQLTGSAAGAINVLSTTADTTNSLIAHVDENFATLASGGRATLDDVRLAVNDAKGVLERVKSGDGTLGRLLNDDALFERLKGIGDEGERTLRNVREMSDRGKAMLEEFGGDGGTGQRLVQSLRATLTQAEEAISDLADGTEALKRNFLFRGFFRQRGFYDLDALTRDAYAAGALEGNDRTALRVWIDQGVLFAQQADGSERLTDEGRRRIDSVMADFLRYPRDSPLVIEGYASGIDEGAAYLQSADRGMIVRDYIRNRFRRRTTLVDFIPMGERAINSPSGDQRWSGVALTLFVRRAALVTDATDRP